MTTKLQGALRREIQIGGEPHVVTIDPHGLRLTRKGRRKGLELAWKDLTSGEAALATALNASLSTLDRPRRTREAARQSGRRAH